MENCECTVGNRPVETGGIMVLSEMPNIGSELEKKLRKANISSPEDLQIFGSKGAFLRLKTIYPEEACINMLYALEGAIQGIRWHHLERDTKEDLLEYYNRLK